MCGVLHRHNHKAKLQTDDLYFNKILTEFPLFYGLPKIILRSEKDQQIPDRVNITTYVYIQADKAAMAGKAAQHTHHIDLTIQTGHNPHVYTYSQTSKQTDRIIGRDTAPPYSRINIYEK